MTTDPARARVALADAHPRMLVSVAMVLEQAGIQVVVATPDLSLATRVCEADAADALIFDPHLVPGSSRAAIASLRLMLPTTTIVVMNMESNAAFARVALRAGASAYVLKSAADTDLADAVLRGTSGERYISPGVGTSESSSGSLP